MRVLVTGSSGFIGRHVVKALLERGDEVFGFDPASALEALPIEEVEDVLAIDFEAIVHLGAITDTMTDDVEALLETNVQLPKKIWRHAAEADIPLVYASSAAVYGAGDLGFEENSIGSPLNPYGKSKLAFDRWATQQTKKPRHWAGLRFFNVYGPGEESKGPMASMVSKAMWASEQEVLLSLFEHGEQRRDFVSVFDVVSVVLWALDDLCPECSGIFNVGSGRATSFEEMAQKVGVDYGWTHMPSALREVFQHYTRAPLRRLRSAGYEGDFRSIDEGIRTYMLAVPA